MKIIINNKRKIFAIQEEFSAAYPGLKIAFHAKPNRTGAAPPEKLVSHNSKTLQECRIIHNEGVVEVLPTMYVGDVKDLFRDVFGLTVEIMHDAGNGNFEYPGSDRITIGQINGQQPY
jgi:hypothetical protein